MIFNVGAGGSTDAEKIKYKDSNVGATLDDLNESVDELNESLGGVSVDYGTLSLASALASVCDNYMSSNNNMSYNGRFKSADGWFTYNAYYCSNQWTGFITSIKTSNNVSYSFFRKVGADAVLKELGSANAPYRYYYGDWGTKTTLEVNCGFEPSFAVILSIQNSVLYQVIIDFENNIMSRYITNSLPNNNNQWVFGRTSEGFYVTNEYEVKVYQTVVFCY